MIRRLAVLAAIGLVASAPIVASAQGYGGGGGGYGNPSVDFDEMLRYQMMLERQQRLRLQQKKALRAKQSGATSPTPSKAASGAADPRKKKQPDKPTGTKAKSRVGSTKAATTKPATTPETRTPVKAKDREKAALTKTATATGSRP